MTARTVRTYPLIWTIAAAAIASACASAPKPSTAAMTVGASADANPDAGGRPSPVVVRVYQLKADTAFNGADFFQLFDDEQKVLGAELINRAEYVLAPSEQQKVELSVSPDARFVGAVAAFRDIRNTQWRTVVPVTPDSEAVTLGVERARIVLSVTD
jgi:type VI secretion system protein VasD